MTSEGMIAILISAFAMAIAAGSLTLELRRWLESGVKLKLNYISSVYVKRTPGPEGVSMHHMNFIDVIVSNRGDSSTTLTDIAFKDSSPLSNKNSNFSYKYTPYTNFPLPYLLTPGSMWERRFFTDEKMDKVLDGGELWLCVRANHSDKPSKIKLKSHRNPEDKKLKTE